MRRRFGYLAIAVVLVMGMAQTRVRIRTIPGAATSVLTQSDFTFLGHLAFETTSIDFSGTIGCGTGRRVSGVVHLLLCQPQNDTTRMAPVEFVDPCSASVTADSCYKLDYTLAPLATTYANWSQKIDTTVYDFWHGCVGHWWDDAGVAADDAHWISGGSSNVLVDGIYIPASDPTKLYVSYSPNYGNYHAWGHCLITLDTVPIRSGGVATVQPVTTAYGPFNFYSNSGVVPSDTAYTDSTHGSVGARRHTYMFDTPSGSMGVGGSAVAGVQQGDGPDGPTAWLGTRPDTTTPYGFGNPVINFTTKLLNYYTNSKGRAGTWPGLQADGAFEAAVSNVTYRHPDYAYVWEGTSCALNPSAPGCPVAGGWVTTQGANLQPDPLKNSGLSTYGETDSVPSMQWILNTTKEGLVALATFTINHTAGNVTTCAQAHNWYCNGAQIGASGFPCSGGTGDLKSPQYQCTSRFTVTGPTTNDRTHPFERFLLVFNAHATAADGFTDYSIVPTSRIYLPDVSASIHLEDPVNSGAPGSHGGSLMASWYDTTTHKLYVFVMDNDTATSFGFIKPNVLVFLVAS